jgi:hypothetical protein
LVADAVFVDGFSAGFVVGFVAAGEAGAAGTAVSVAEPVDAAVEPLADAACDGTAIIEMRVVVPAPGAAGGQDLVTEVTVATCPTATAG